MKQKVRSPPKLATGRLSVILACLPITCKHTGGQGCVSIYPALYRLGACWYKSNRQKKETINKYKKETR